MNNRLYSPICGLKKGYITLSKWNVICPRLYLTSLAGTQFAQLELPEPPSWESEESGVSCMTEHLGRGLLVSATCHTDVLSDQFSWFLKVIGLLFLGQFGTWVLMSVSFLWTTWAIAPVPHHLFQATQWSLPPTSMELPCPFPLCNILSSKPCSLGLFL